MTHLIDVRDLSLEFDVRGMRVPVLDKVSFRIRPGTTVALVGESGSGKSVTAQAMMGILPHNGHITGGKILLSDPKGADAPVDIAKLDRDGPGFRAIRGRRISMIFQEPMLSLSPVHTVGDQVSEALFLHHAVAKDEGMRQTAEMLGLVGFPDPVRALKMYPFELSGGLRQRAMIAMALICRPSLLIADEPTTALDVTIQAQILELLRDLQQRLGMAILIITHDLGVIAELVDEVIVMYAGKIVESAPVRALFADPQHPYTIGLLGSIPRLDIERERLATIEGTVPSPANQPAGCRFAPRCPFADARCHAEPPPLRELGVMHRVACWKAPVESTGNT